MDVKTLSRKPKSCRPPRGVSAKKTTCRRRQSEYSHFDECLTETEDRLRDSLASLRARSISDRVSMFACVRIYLYWYTCAVVYTCTYNDRDLHTRGFNSVHHLLSARPTPSSRKKEGKREPTVVPVNFRIYQGRTCVHLCGRLPT